MQYCSLHHRTSVSAPDTSTTDHHFCFGPTSSFFLELLVIALYSFPVAYCTPSDLGTHLSVSYLFAFYTVHGVLMARILERVAVPSPSGQVLSELFIMIHLFSVTLHGMAHSFIELLKPLHHDKAVIHRWVPCSSGTQLGNIASWWGKDTLDNLWKHFWCHNQGVWIGI